MIDCNYLIRVRDYMPVPLPRPRLKKKSIIVNYGEWLPIIDGYTGKVVKV